MRSDRLILSDRSRAVEHQRCHRARFWMYEYRGRGVAPVRLSLALVKGSAFHAGAAELAMGLMQRQFSDPVPLVGAGLIDAAVEATHAEFDRITTSRGIDLGRLDATDELNGDFARMLEEERQGAGAMVRVYAKRALPQLLERTRILQVEQEHVAPLPKAALIRSHAGPGFTVARQVPVQFMSRPDAVLLACDGEIETLSLKTTATWDDRKQREAEHDMQNLSEPCAVNGWLRELWFCTRATNGTGPVNINPALYELVKASPYPPTVASTRMIFVIGGERREVQPGHWASMSPLVRGYRRSIGGLRYEYAWSPFWRCSEPHSMRKSKWYPDAQCPGDGRRHKLAEDFEQFAVWQDEEIGGVAGWVDRLDRGLVQPEAGDALAQQIVILPPIVRHQPDIDRWHRQISAQEAQVAEDSWHANQLLDAGRLDDLDQFLDERFPMHTRACDYPGRCPFQELCWNPEAARDPLATGLYLPRVAHHEMERQQLEPADAAA